jgi:dihydroxy-acid dehydratase
MEDVHRAGGIPAILGELDRAGLLHRDVHAVHAPSLKQWLADWDIRSGSPSPAAVELFHAAPGGVRTTTPFSTANRWSSLDTDAAEGCIRDRAHAYTIEGGLAVLYGNLAKDGAVLKTAGVPEEIWHSHPTAFLKGARLGKVCALVTDGRFSGGSSGVAVGHISPEAAAGGAIGLVEDGDRIVIDVQERALRLMVDDDVLAERRAKMDASERPWQPVDRQRPVAKSLRAYARMATSAATGAVRDPHR